MRVLFSPSRIRLEPRNPAERAVARKIGKRREVTALSLGNLPHPPRMVLVSLTDLCPAACQMSGFGFPRGFHDAPIPMPAPILPLGCATARAMVRVGRHRRASSLYVLGCIP